MIFFKNKILINKALTLFELLIVLCVIFLLMGTFAIYANVVLTVSRQTALQNELVNIRMAIEYYRIIIGKTPASLSDLINNKLTTNIFGGKILVNSFLKPFRVDKEGFLLDPFFHRYGFDEQKGMVYSQTQGYERW